MSLENAREYRTNVAKLSRLKLQPNLLDNKDFVYSVDHNRLVKRNLRSYAKKFIESKTRILPSFDGEKCVQYFTTMLRAVSPSKFFTIPSWIPALPAPHVQFDLQPPSYRQITSVIRKMKSSGSPCPLDQISIICFKRCPSLRSYISVLIAQIGRNQSIPSAWKKAVTILIHKKGDNDDPAIFRPITLQSVPLKIFTACLRNRIF